MEIKIKLTTGKEIVVTKDELDELLSIKDKGLVPVYIPQPIPYKPWSIWEYHPYVYCSTNTTPLTDCYTVIC